MPKQLDASFVTEVVILLTWALTTWYVYFTFIESGHAKRKTYHASRIKLYTLCLLLEQITKIRRKKCLNTLLLI